MSTQTHLMTAEELFALPDDGFRHELIKGELLTMSPPGEEHGAFGLKLAFRLEAYAEPRELGRVYLEIGFKVESDPDTVLAPDLSFIKHERVGMLSDRYRLGVPDLAIEIISPNDRKREVEEKTARWLGAGVKAVWLVNPKTRTVDVRLATGERKLFTENDVLVDNEVVVGFSVHVSKIFA